MKPSHAEPGKRARSSHLDIQAHLALKSLRHLLASLASMPNGRPTRRSPSTSPLERHTQVEIRATVAPVPISEVARVAYRPK